MKHRRIPDLCVLAVLAFCATEPASAQSIPAPHWSLQFEPQVAAPGSSVMGKMTVQLEPGWHIYSIGTPKGGPIPTTLSLAPNPAIKSFEVFEPKAVRKLDPNFGIETETYEGTAVFLIRTKIAESATAGKIELTANVRHMMCRDTQCIPPRKFAASGELVVDPKAPAAPSVVPAGYVKAVAAEAPATPAAAANATKSIPAGSASQDLGAFLAVAFVAGLGAIFTPCVFPMIPITLSFFLNREGATRADSVKQAAVFCAGIVLLFTLLGITLATVIGPFAVVQLGANPWVNGFIALIFLVFGLSLLGAYEITLPSGLVNRMNSASQRGGILGTLLMGLTFSLTSFACVGPFVGPLLAASAQQGGAQPVLGMATFALGLSSPFFLLALFPSYLKRMPRSGGWLVRVKVVLGFVVLAVMLKYLSNIDQVLQWNVLTRERFLAAWIVFFALPGLYLLGFLRLEGIDPQAPLGVARMLTGAAFLVFSFSLVPGMFGRGLGEIDSFVPLAQEGAVGSGAAGAAPVWLKNQFAEALARARNEKKLVLMDFTGYACTNCHWMKANMLNRPEIAAALQNLVLVELYTDGTDSESEKNQNLQQSKFGTVAIPFYAIVDPEERIIATFANLERSPSVFLSFLTSK